MNENKAGCPIDAMQYIFDAKGHTHAICVAERGDRSGYMGRDLCPHFNGNCPARGKRITMYKNRYGWGKYEVGYS